MKISIQLSCILLFLTSTIFCFSQEWVARYNGPANDWESAHAIAVDDAGNVYVTGQSGYGNSHDYATIKYNSLGVEQWVARYNGPGDDDDDAWAIAIDGVGNVYVTGTSDGSAGTGKDYATVKYDASGVEQWSARYNGPHNFNDYAYAMALDNLGNVYVTGRSMDTVNWADFVTVKYNSSGVEQWVARYNGPANVNDCSRAIALDNAGNIYVTGYINDGYSTTSDYATIKYNSSGVEQWVAIYDGPINHIDIPNAIAVDDAVNIYVTGRSAGSGTGRDYATVKYDASGVEQWVVRYNGTGSVYVADDAYAIALDSVGNIYVTGESCGSGTVSDYATIKYDSSGVEQWVVRYNGPGNGRDVAYAIVVDNAGNVYVTGASGSDIYVDYATVKYDASGVEQWSARYNGPANMLDLAYAIAVDDAGNVYVTGTSVGLGTYYDYATIKYSPIGIEENMVTVKKGNEIITTIFSGPLQLPKGKTCKVYDITGRVVIPEKIKPGVYFIEIDGVVTQKVVKVR